MYWKNIELYYFPGLPSHNIIRSLLHRLHPALPAGRAARATAVEGGDRWGLPQPRALPCPGSAPACQWCQTARSVGQCFDETNRCLSRLTDFSLSKYVFVRLNLFYIFQFVFFYECSCPRSLYIKVSCWFFTAAKPAFVTDGVTPDSIDTVNILSQYEAYFFICPLSPCYNPLGHNHLERDLRGIVILRPP